VVFSASQGSSRERRLEIATLAGRVTPLDLYGTNPMFIAPNILVFVRLDGVAEAVRFDPKSYRVTGKPVQVLEGVTMRGAPPFPSIAASANGNLLAYVHGLPRSRLALLSATGETQLLAPEPRRYRHPRVSPTGDRIVVDISAPDGSQDVWVYEIKSTALSRLTFDGRSTDPVWSPDGKRIAFSRVDTASGAPDVYTVAADGSDQPRLFIGGAGSQYAGGWTADGKSFVYDELRIGRPMRMVMLDTSGASHPLAESPTAAMRLPAMSPDGRWVAYSSTESGHIEIYVRSLSGPGRWQVSTGGGAQPVWSKDSKTIYYREAGHIVAATVGTGGTGFTVASRRTFAEDHFMMENTINYDAMPDGRHLAVIVPMDEGAQISVVVNWNAELEKRLKP
jgi:Tol biopolymer transport system component